LFTWNDVIDFTNQVPIGDPYLYLKDELVSNQPESTRKENYVLVIPKFRRLLSISERLDVYQRILSDTQKNFPDYKKMLMLHPEECFTEIKNTLSLDACTWEIIDRSLQQSISEVKANMLTLVQAQLMVTDYLGAHVMRRLVISGKDSLLIENWKSWRGIDPEIQELLDVLEVEVSKILLGEKFLRDRNGLSSLLGFTGVKKIIGPRVMEQYYRRVDSQVEPR
jgi:hypothetical protein